MNKVNIIEIRTIEDILKIYKEYKLLDKTQKIVFDFSGAKFIYSNFTAFFGALIDNSKSYQVLKPNKEKVKTVLSKNNFLPNYTDLTKLNDRSQSVIAFEKFTLDDLDKQNIFFDKLLNKKLLKQKGVTNLSDKVLKIVSQNIIELFDNTREHSKSTQGIYIAGQFFKEKQKFDFTIVDMGVGIVKNVNSFLTEKLKSGEAIHWAMQKQHSTRIGEPGGLGLALLKELIMKSNGKIEVISNDGYYFIKNQEEGFEDLDIAFQGTIINIEFNIDGQIYSLKDEDNK